VLVGCGGTAPAAHPGTRSVPGPRVSTAGGQAGLARAVQGLSAARGPLLHRVEAVQAAAGALDQADAVCLRGQGPPARTSHGLAAPLLAPAQAALPVLTAELAAYLRALAALEAAAQGLPAPKQSAVQRVVADGRTEAQALAGFRAAAVSALPAYEQLDRAEATWVGRAVTPWYRSAQEGSDAYAVLVSDGRPGLTVARQRLGAAAAAVSTAVRKQSAALRAADVLFAAP